MSKCKVLHHAKDLYDRLSPDNRLQHSHKLVPGNTTYVEDLHLKYGKSHVTKDNDSTRRSIAGIYILDMSNRKIRFCCTFDDLEEIIE